MKFNYYPGSEAVSIEIDSLHFYSGYIDRSDKEDHSITITVSENIDIEKVIKEIHNSVIAKGYPASSIYVERSVRKATEPIEGRWYSNDYKNNWKRILYITINPGISGFKDPGSFNIS